MFSSKSYQKTIKESVDKSPIFKNCVFAFLIGGFICAVGEGLKLCLLSFCLSEKQAALTVTIFLIFLSALLTGLGIYDNIAKVAGAGTLVPVTGFANAVVSPALDTKSEGLIVGVGTKIFSVSGPVILFATLSGVLYGVILWVYRVLGGVL